ncbi:carbohydrate sulfotransferase 8-like [Penaeus japonicus]|uniref:carbohydrate sulfotransferase 8-like n=1 Tax=Penaeus japonicus TaxID=27405 RepID=UPI001C70E1CF|nr:carbohydrate sulfotransferase 8-like [Penaeus japonicus]
MKPGRRLHWLSGIIASGMLIYLYALKQSPTPVPFLQNTPRPLDTQRQDSFASTPSDDSTAPFLTIQETGAPRPPPSQLKELLSRGLRRDTEGRLEDGVSPLGSFVGGEGRGGGDGDGEVAGGGGGGGEKSTGGIESGKGGGGGGGKGAESEGKGRKDDGEDKVKQETIKARKEGEEIGRNDGESKPKEDTDGNGKEEPRENRDGNKITNGEERKSNQTKDKESQKDEPEDQKGETTTVINKTKTLLVKENETATKVKENEAEKRRTTEPYKEVLSVDPKTETGANQTRRLMTQEEYLRVKKIHQDRISLVKERCKKFTPTATRGLTALINRGSDYRLGNKLFLPQDVINSNFQIDKRDRVTFCWQYKVGSTAWNAMFAHLLNQTSVIRRKTFYDMRNIMTVKTMREFKRSMVYYKFLIVREPLERLLSAYRDRIEDTSHRSWQRENYVPKILKVTRPHLKNGDIRFNGKLFVIPTFREFVEYLLVTPIGNYDPHWRPYWKHCSPCVVSFQAIGRAETQAQDIRFILEDSGLARKIDNKVLEENAHHGRGSTHDLLVSYYSTLDISTLEKLYRLYEVDYYIFGYDIQVLLDELHPHRNISFKSRF